eukprot:scaffold9354_cov108-Isochrysis_galbana.AAC.8
MRGHHDTTRSPQSQPRPPFSHCVAHAKEPHCPSAPRRSSTSPPAPRPHGYHHHHKQQASPRHMTRPTGPHRLHVACPHKKKKAFIRHVAAVICRENSRMICSATRMRPAGSRVVARGRSPGERA